jgi:hypothetical protein
MERMMYKKSSHELERLLKEFSTNQFERDKQKELMATVNNFVSIIEKL